MIKAKQNRLATTILCLMLLMAILVPLGTISVHAAGNYSDSLFEDKVNEYDCIGEATTHFRGKWDYTSSYAYNMKSSCDFTEVNVLGAYTEMPGVDFYDCTYGAPKNLPIGEAYYLPNLVKENGYDNGGLEVMFPIGSEPYIYVWWSPDSI